jgi:hypothetical protein
MKHPFEYQSPSATQSVMIIEVREATKTLYETVLSAGVPNCDERTIAIRKLEEFSMWVNKAIVFDGERYLR